MADTMVNSLMNITGANLPRGDFFELVKVSPLWVTVVVVVVAVGRGPNDNLMICLGHVQAIGEAKSKQEEDRIIMDEMGVLKAKMPTQVIYSPSSSPLPSSS